MKPVSFIVTWKPANIKVRDKVLDFGLAKALDTAPADDLDQLPTRTSEGTQTGTVLGTAAYMSPEQARGKSVDRRSDIWAFGVVLYEMLTGTRAFQGEAVADCLAKIIEVEPRLSRFSGNRRTVVGKRKSRLTKSPA